MGREDDHCGGRTGRQSRRLQTASRVVRLMGLFIGAWEGGGGRGRLRPKWVSFFAGFLHCPLGGAACFDISDQKEIENISLTRGHGP